MILSEQRGEEKGRVGRRREGRGWREEEGADRKMKGEGGKGGGEGRR